MVALQKGAFSGTKEVKVADEDKGTTNTRMADPVQVPIGPVTRARAKRFKEALNGLIQSIFLESNSLRPIEQDPRSPTIVKSVIQVLEDGGLFPKA